MSPTLSLPRPPCCVCPLCEWLGASACHLSICDACVIWWAVKGDHLLRWLLCDDPPACLVISESLWVAVAMCDAALLVCLAASLDHVTCTQAPACTTICDGDCCSHVPHLVACLPLLGGRGGVGARFFCSVSTDLPAHPAPPPSPPRPHPVPTPPPSVATSTRVGPRCATRWVCATARRPSTSTP